MISHGDPAEQDPTPRCLSGHDPAAEVARRLSVSPGQELEWIEDGMGGFRVIPHTPETAEALEAHARVMTEYDSVFRALAK